jgi:hypothetical protein
LGEILSYIYRVFMLLGEILSYIYRVFMLLGEILLYIYRVFMLLGEILYNFAKESKKKVMVLVFHTHFSTGRRTSAENLVLEMFRILVNLYQIFLFAFLILL